jgi:threonine/homoserine/homoserine lactone efflux protein
MASVFGLLLGDQVMLWLTVAGVAALLQTMPSVFVGVQVLGAAYLLYLGWRLLMAKPGQQVGLDITPGYYFRETFFITLLNPKAIVFYMAFFPQFIDPTHHQGLLTFAVLAATVWVLGFAYCTGVVCVTHFMAEKMRANPRAVSALQKLAGLCLMGFGLKMLASSMLSFK